MDRSAANATRWVLLILAAVSSFACAEVDGDPPGEAPSVFVRVRDGHFELEGRRHLFVGTNFWQGMNLGVDGALGDRERLNRELDRLVALGVTNLRVMAASEGPDSEPYRTVPSLMPERGRYNEEVFRGLDVLLDALAQRQLKAVMVLNNYWQWSGGMAQYVSWATGEPIAYPNDTGDWGAFMALAARFYTCSECQDVYRAHVTTVVNRINTVNGRAYRDDPTIFAWELANEPRNYPLAWIDQTAAFIKGLDSNHMVTTGSEGWIAGDFASTHASASVDYATFHLWVENWGRYDPDRADDAHLQSAIDYARSYVETHEGSARELGKPVVLEEFGLARDGWSAGSKLDPGATTTHRDRYYQAVFGAVEAAMAQDGALAGDNFWAWGGEARPGDRWLGDPPHEPPGWYSIYDTDDSTRAIIRAHAQYVREMAQP